MKHPLRFPKDARLRTRREFQRVSRYGQRVIGQYICVDFRRAHSLKLGITASGKYGSSPERNRFKRQIRETFRTCRPLLPKNLEIHILPRQKAKGALSSEIREEFLRLIGHV